MLNIRKVRHTWICSRLERHECKEMSTAPLLSAILCVSYNDCSALWDSGTSGPITGLSAGAHKNASNKAGVVRSISTTVEQHKAPAVGVSWYGVSCSYPAAGKSVCVLQVVYRNGV